MPTKLQTQSDLYNKINHFAEQFDIGFQLAEHIYLPNKISRVVICTYGIPAALTQVILDLFTEGLNDKNIQIYTDYGLPENIDNETLVLAIDLEQDHPAVLSSIKQAYDNKVNIVSVTTGGELEKFSRERQLGLIYLGEKYNGYLKQNIYSGILLGIVVQVLINSKILSNKDKFSLLGLGEELEKLYLPKLGERLASQIDDSTILLYTEPALLGLAQFMKAHLNIEFSIPVFCQTLPQAFGEELLGFSQKNFAKYAAIFPYDQYTDQQYIKDFEIAGKLLDQAKISHHTWELPGATRQLSILAGIILIYWATYTLNEK